jgi:hypothetical protein
MSRSKRLGICAKCKQYKIVQSHHIHGYSEEHKDDVVDYCQSCDQKAHRKAKKEGKCNLSIDAIKRLTSNSSHRRTRKQLIINETMMKYVSLVECYSYITTTGNVIVNGYFGTYSGRKLFYIDI